MSQSKDPKAKAIALLKNKDKTEYEIKEALLKAQFDQAQIDETIEYLKELRYIDDIKYANNYIESSMEKNRGPNRMRRELESKGVSINDIEDCIYEMIDDEWEIQTAQKIVDDISYKYSNLKEEKLLAKIVNKLNYEGFSEDVINDITNDMINY